MSLSFDLAIAASVGTYPGVDYVGVINKQGRLQDCLYKNDIHLIKKTIDVLCLQVALDNQIQKDCDDGFRSVKNTIIEKDGKKIVLVPTTSDVILAVMNKEANHSDFIKKITSITNCTDSGIFTKLRRQGNKKIKSIRHANSVR